MICFASECEYMHSYFLLISENLGYNEIGLRFFLRDVYKRQANYYSFAITILTIANIFAILTAAILKKIGEKKTSWTGDGTQLIRKGGDFATEDKKVKVSMKDLGGAFFLAIGFYALGRLFAKALLPTIFGVAIHQFAYMIIFVALVAALGLSLIHI